MGEQRRHRIGFIGLGNRGRSHLRTLLCWYADRAVPVAAADPGPQHFTARPVQAFGWPVEIPLHRCFRDYRDLLALDDVDAVVVATYEAAHLEITLAALDAGKAVLLEKAAVISLAEAETLYRRLISRRPDRFQLALNLRHHEVVQTLRRLLAEQAIERVVAVTAHVNAGHAWGASVFRCFYRDAALSGDLVLSKLTHDSDVLHYLLGTYAETVTGVAARTTFVPRPDAGPVCRSCQITATCPSYIDVTATPAAWADHERRQAFGLDPADLCPYTAASTSHDTAMFSGVYANYANGAVFSLVFTTAGPVYARPYQFNGTGGEIVAVIGGREGDAVVWHALGQAPVHLPVPPAAGGHGGADPRLMGRSLDYLDSEKGAGRTRERADQRDGPARWPAGSRRGPCRWGRGTGPCVLATQGETDLTTPARLPRPELCRRQVKMVEPRFPGIKIELIEGGSAWRRSKQAWLRACPWT